MSGGNANNNTQNQPGSTPGSVQVTIANPAPQTTTPVVKSWFTRAYEYVVNIPSRLSGREITGTDVASAATSLGKFVLDTANSQLTSYNTPEARLGISLMLTLSAFVLDYKNYREKIGELDRLQTDFLKSLNSDVISEYTFTRKDGTTETFTDIENNPPLDNFKDCLSMTVTVKSHGEITLYNMKQWSKYTAISRSSAATSLALLATCVACMGINYAYRTSPIASGSLKSDDGLNANITVDTTQIGATLPINGNFTVAGDPGNCTVNDTALQEAYAAALATNQTLNASSVQLLTGQPFSVDGKFEGTASTAKSGPLNDSTFVNVDYYSSLFGGFPVLGAGDWLTTLILKQHTSIKEGALGVYNILKTKLAHAEKNEIIAPEVPETIIDILRKTSNTSTDVTMARELQNNITKHNAKTSQSNIMQPQINAAVQATVFAENSLAKEQKMHEVTKQEKKSAVQERDATQDKLNISEQSIRDKQSVIDDLQNIYQALVIKDSAVIVKQINQTGRSELGDGVNAYISQLKTAAAQPGVKADGKALLEGVVKLVETITDIAQQTQQLAVAVNSAEAASEQPEVVKTPGNLGKKTVRGMVSAFNQSKGAPLADKVQVGPGDDAQKSVDDDTPKTPGRRNSIP